AAAVVVDLPDRAGVEADLNEVGRGRAGVEPVEPAAAGAVGDAPVVDGGARAALVEDAVAVHADVLGVGGHRVAVERERRRAAGGAAAAMPSGAARAARMNTAPARGRPAARKAAARAAGRPSKVCDVMKPRPVVSIQLLIPRAALNASAARGSRARSPAAPAG